MTSKVYLVGGAVRDALLGLPVQERDWCVVGSTRQNMLDAGYRSVGKDFPVFLHPVTQEEYALARTERKTAAGYHGFAVQADAQVTLEEDLSRRDLTINSIALNEAFVRAGGSLGLQSQAVEMFHDDWREHLIDPFGGQQDLERQQFRHITSAFAEDPVRILRVARFAARFAHFSVASETLALMQHMVSAGEADALVAERVWQEISKGLMESKPSRMFEVLRACGALERILPSVNKLWGVPQRAEYHPEIDTGIHVMMVLDMAAQLQAPLAVRVACLMHDLGKGTTPADVLPRHIGHEERSVRLLLSLCERLRVPQDCKELAVVVAREHGNIHRSQDLSAAATLRLLERCDAIRKPLRFTQILQACECDARGRLGKQDHAYPQAARLLHALQAAQAVQTAGIAAEAIAQGKVAAHIGQSIAAARVKAIAAVL